VDRKTRTGQGRGGRPDPKNRRRLSTGGRSVRWHALAGHDNVHIRAGQQQPDIRSRLDVANFRPNAVAAIRFDHRADIVELRGHFPHGLLAAQGPVDLDLYRLASDLLGREIDDVQLSLHPHLFHADQPKDRFAQLHPVTHMLHHFDYLDQSRLPQPSVHLVVLHFDGGLGERRFLDGLRQLGDVQLHTRRVHVRDRVLPLDLDLAEFALAGDLLV